MPKRLSKEDFIKRAEIKHGNKYDYSKIQYVDTKTKIAIICPLHGEFQQTPDKHMQGRGCPKCSQTKMEETNLKKYGVKHPLQNKDILNKMKATNIKHYGVENVACVQEVKDKMKETCQKRYGTDYAVQADLVKQQCEKTNSERYGGVSPFSSKDVQEKAKNSIIAKYGVDNVAKNDNIHNKMEQTCLKRYGFKSPLSNPDVQVKKLQTMYDKYGSNCPFTSKDIRQKSENTFMRKYGVRNSMQLDTVKQKVCDSKKANNSFNKSDSEDVLYEKLCDVFDENDVIRQYKSDNYPFMCDFYIKSRDLRIELNASWTHGKHWFDDTDDNDLSVLQDWNDKSKDSDYYENAVHVWTEMDVLKREYARSNNLNYVVFWDSSLRDADLWFGMNCPDGQDWDKEYSWIDTKNELSIPKMKFTGNKRNISMIAKYYQQSVIYENEMKLWTENKQYSGTSLRLYLYHNRYKYLNKTPDLLSDIELLNGFKISGICKGYTVFDIELMDKVIKKYNIKSVYDPFAGWGERMLYCYCNNIVYLGVDINEKLKAGYENMMSDFDMKQQNIIFADSSEYISNDKFDAVITCPPYYDTEIYSDKGIENLSEIDFLNKWKEVVINSINTGIKYFCFQINKKWCEKMSDVITECGGKFIEKIDMKSKSSHFTRRNGVNSKKEYESMVVFQI